MLEFLNNPVVEVISDDLCKLREDFILKYWDWTFIIPEGTLTDFASVPRLPVVYRIFANKAKKSAIWHDWIYGSHPEGFTRKMADDAFLDAMRAEKLPEWVCLAMYAGVRVGGGSHY
jgi:hypothetical protein